MRILITGGNGYVGRTLTRLLAPEHDVCVVDNLRDNAVRFQADELDAFRFEQTDIRDAAAVTHVVADFAPETIIHLAAIHYIPECEAKPDQAVAINTLGTVNLLRSAPEGSRFVLASTAAVYAPEDTPHDEASSPIGPMDVYGFTKLHAEQYVRYYAAARGLDARIVRLFNVVGPGETNPHLLPAILAQALHGTRTLHLGNTSPSRDYVHVSDVAAGFAAVATGARATEGVDLVNLGTGTGWTVDQVVDQLSRVIGERLTIETDPARVRASDRPYLAAATARMREHYGWTAQRTLEDALRDLWADPDIPASLLRRS